MSNQHQYTVECLYHFTCGSCEHWWSYAVTPFSQPFTFTLNDVKIYCPHCGYCQSTEIKEGFWLEKMQKSAEKT